MAVEDFKLHDVVRNVNTGGVGIITEVSEKWGWFKVSYESGRVFEYSCHTQMYRVLRILTKEQYADHLLQRENSGVSDSWRE